MNFSREPVMYEGDTRGKYRGVSPEEERELGLRARTGDAPAKARLIEAFTPLALNRAAWFTSRQLPRQEARAIASTALVRAVDTFDPDKGRLGAYAELYIEGALKRESTKAQRASRTLGSEADVAKSETLSREAWNAQVSDMNRAQVFAEILDMLPSLPPKEEELLRHIWGGGSAADWAASQTPPKSKAWASRIFSNALARLGGWLRGEPRPAPRQAPVSVALTLNDPFEPPWWDTKSHDLDAPRGDRGDGLYASGFPEAQSDLWKQRERDDQDRRERRAAYRENWSQWETRLRERYGKAQWTCWTPRTPWTRRSIAPCRSPWPAGSWPGATWATSTWAHGGR